MVYREREVRAQFSQPVRQILLMLIVVAGFAAGAYVAYPRVAPVFLANPWLNGAIGVVFVIGVLACFLQVGQLISSVSWIEGFAGNRPGFDLRRPPRLLAPLAALLRSREARMQIGSASARSILDSAATRLDERRDITRYLINLLIFLGLLGTFYGLATTVPAVVDTIRSLAPTNGESSTAVFGRLIAGLETQLGGMGTAFASSLLGLAGSLVVGLLDLFAGHGQNRFYQELEEWLSSITRIGVAGGDGDGAEMGVVATILDQMAEQMDVMKGMITQADMSWVMVDERLGALSEAV
ncbi:MAG: biopolymer transporter ExbB, partial [Qingshengfaniella sp.]